MSKQIFQYETIGNKSFLITTLADSKDLINYQMQMLANNEISNILPVTKRQKNEDIQLCYDVTSKISLSQANSRGKMSKKGFLELIEGVVSVFNEIGEYQLVSSGLVLDHDYIFVKAGSFEPSFVYMPTHSKDLGIAPLKDFLFGLILQSKVEMTNDNFIQIMLETLNSPTLSVEELEKIVKKYGEKSMPAATQVGQPHTVRQGTQGSPNPATPVSPQPSSSPLQPRRQEDVQTPIGASIQSASEASIPQRPPIIQNRQTAPLIPPKPGVKADENKIKKKTQDNQTKQQHPKKNLFLFIQLGMLAAIVAISMTGLLYNDSGSVNFKYLLGLLIPVAGVDFVLYREWFKNGDKEKSDKKASIKDKQSAKSIFAKDKQHPRKVSGLSIAIPGRASAPSESESASVIAVPEPAPLPHDMSELPQAQAPGQPSIANVQVEMPDAVYAGSVYTNYSAKEELNNTVMLDEYDVTGVHLEYFNNGLSMKINLDKPSVIVGRMRSQVDYMIDNPKIGRLHAEFISDGGNFYVKDYNSKNGTYINGESERIPGNTLRQIFNGDKIVLANVELTLRC